MQVKRWLVVITFAALNPVAWAQTAADIELLSAQKAYQQSLVAQQSQQSNLLDKQQQLVVAKQRLVEVQSAITRLEAEVATAQAAHTQTEQALQTASQKLDTAWSAARQ